MVNRIKNERYLIVSSCFIALIILLLPLLLRMHYNSTLLIGDEPYYHLRISQEMIAEKSISFIDRGIVYGREYNANPYHLVLGLLSILIGGDAAAKILPPILGIIALLLFSILLRYFGMMREYRIYALFLLVLTPAFIYAFSVSNAESLSIVLILLGVYLGLRQGWIFKSFSVLIFTIVASISLFHGLLTGAILMLYFMQDPKRNGLPFWLGVAVIMLSIAYSPRLIYAPQGIIEGTFSDLGAMAGFGIFSIILAFLGIFYIWKKKRAHMFLYGLLIYMLANLLFFGSAVNPYFAFVIALFSALGLSFLIERNWELDFIKKLAVIIVCLGMILSAASFINRLAQKGPDEKTINALNFLKMQQPGAVLSHSSNGFWIEYAAEKPVLEDSYTKNNISSTIFFSRDLDNTKKMLGNNSITYIYIDSNMKNGEVWEKPEEGLLFLFRNNETFKSIYFSNGIEIWKVLRR